MSKTTANKIGNYEIIYKLERENGFYYIIVAEKENSSVIKSGRFATPISEEKVAHELLNLLCENQVGAVHVEDILKEMGYGIEHN